MMVKGVNRRVIVVHAPEPKLFEQAIFILKDGVEGVTDEELLKQARKAAAPGKKRRDLFLYGTFWAAVGAALTAAAWVISALV